MSLRVFPIGTTPNFLTTGQIGRICGVTPQTVIHWLNNGKLQFTRLERGRRHIPVTEVIQFLKRNNHPLPEWMRDLETKAA